MIKSKKSLHFAFLSITMTLSGFSAFGNSAYAQGYINNNDAIVASNSLTRTTHSYLASNDTMYASNICEMVSKNEKKNLIFKLCMQLDGNLVLYKVMNNLDQQGQILWATNTGGSGANRAVMQSDGNFVLYKPNGIAVWASNTPSANQSVLMLHPDGNLTVSYIHYMDSIPTYFHKWETGTN